MKYVVEAVVAEELECGGWRGAIRGPQERVHRAAPLVVGAADPEHRPVPLFVLRTCNAESRS